LASKSRNKGNYHETKILDWIETLGFKAKKQPLSGQLGGEYRGDILIEIGGEDLVVEVKYRDSGSFPSAFTVMEQRDIAIFKKKTGKPRQVVIIDGDVFANTIAPLLVDNKPKKKRRKQVPEDWQPSLALCESINKKLQENMNHDDETNRFRDHHISKGSLFASIDTAYRNWCRNSIKYREEKQGGATPASNRKPSYSRQKPSFFAGVHNRTSNN
tara:strand:- start:1338 stop:1982 length:645 start_codon:yes stop_codon:yes gene_type:complete